MPLRSASTFNSKRFMGPNQVKWKTKYGHIGWEGHKLPPESHCQAGHRHWMHPSSIPTVWPSQCSSHLLLFVQASQLGLQVVHQIPHHKGQPGTHCYDVPNTQAPCRWMHSVDMHQQKWIQGTKWLLLIECLVRIPAFKDSVRTTAPTRQQDHCTASFFPYSG